MITHIEKCEKGTPGYPAILDGLKGMPQCLYFKGDISILNRMKSVAIVGSRECTERALSFSREAGALAAAKNVIVINGLAIGCDTAAIEGAVSNGGKCVAIMPSGLNSIYPKSNSKLADEILECGGCIISEYAPDIVPHKYTYVQRDRLQSALAGGVFVVEAGLGSGTMHTVEAALKQNRVLGAYADAMIKASGNQLVIDKHGKPISNIKDLEQFIEDIPQLEENRQMTLWDM